MVQNLLMLCIDNNNNNNNNNDNHSNNINQLYFKSLALHTESMELKSK